MLIPFELYQHIAFVCRDKQVVRYSLAAVLLQLAARPPETTGVSSASLFKYQFVAVHTFGEKCLHALQLSSVILSPLVCRPHVAKPHFFMNGLPSAVRDRTTSMYSPPRHSPQVFVCQPSCSGLSSIRLIPRRVDLFAVFLISVGVEFVFAPSFFKDGDCKAGSSASCQHADNNQYSFHCFVSFKNRFCSACLRINAASARCSHVLSATK